MSETRTRITEHVRAHPGIHFNDLVRGLDLAPGQVQYHLRVLRGEDAVAEERLYGRTHYYPTDCDPWERAALALLRRETARDVVVALLEDGPDRPDAVAETVGIARSTLEWHVDRLAEQGLVRKRRDGDGRVTLVLERPAETARLLQAADTSPLPSAVDRFERLVDDLLEG